MHSLQEGISFAFKIREEYSLRFLSSVLMNGHPPALLARTLLKNLKEERKKDEKKKRRKRTDMSAPGALGCVGVYYEDSAFHRE